MAKKTSVYVEGTQYNVPEGFNCLAEPEVVVATFIAGSQECYYVDGIVHYNRALYKGNDGKLYYGFSNCYSGETPVFTTGLKFCNNLGASHNLAGIITSHVVPMETTVEELKQLFLQIKLALIKQTTANIHFDSETRYLPKFWRFANKNGLRFGKAQKKQIAAKVLAYGRKTNYSEAFHHIV